MVAMLMVMVVAMVMVLVIMVIDGACGGDNSVDAGDLILMAVV